MKMVVNGHHNSKKKKNERESMVREKGMEGDLWGSGKYGGKFIMAYSES